MNNDYKKNTTTIHIKNIWGMHIKHSSNVLNNRLIYNSHVN